jgi:O-antigen biosynthesis protein
LRFSAHIVSGDEKSKAGRWRITCHYGDDRLEDVVTTFYFFRGRIHIHHVMPLRGLVSSYRIEPTNFPCEFVVDTFELLPLNFVAGISKFVCQWLAGLHEQRLLGKALTRSLVSFASARPKRAIQALHRPTTLVALTRYQQWIKARKITESLRSKFAEKIETLARRPTFSIVMPTFNSHPEFLDRAICSVKNQIYPHWELCIADDGSTSPSVREVLDRYKEDERIKTVFLKKNEGIANASNAALNLATGEYIALLDHDDEIAPHALYAFADAINGRPDADWLYSDEDKMDENGRRWGPLFKPQWCPAFFQGCMYTCHLGVYRRELVTHIGGFRSQFDFAQDYDLALRFARITTRIVHVPDVLYHWRALPQSTASGAAAKPDAEAAARRALQAYLDSGPIKAYAETGPFAGSHRPKYEILGSPLVSISIPSAGRQCEVEDGSSWFVLELVRSIRTLTEFSNFEIVVAENGDFDTVLREQLDGLGVRRVVYQSPVFNISEKINFVVEATRGDYVVILNDDMIVMNGSWLTEMLMWCQQDDVAAVGAKLIFPSDRIQHAGVMLFEQGPSHIYYNEDNASAVGLAGSAVMAREYSAVTGACLMTRRKDFFDINGFDPTFRINYNDIDFCVRLRIHTGGRVIYTPYAMLYHHESVSRDPAPPEELSIFNKRWTDRVGFDPYYNIHLSQTSSVCALRDYILPIESQYELD